MSTESPVQSQKEEQLALLEQELVRSKAQFEQQLEFERSQAHVQRMREIQVDIAIDR